MAEESKPNVFGGFEALAGEILDKPHQKEIPEIEPEKLLKKEVETEEEEEEEVELTEDEKLELEENESEEEAEEEVEEETEKETTILDSDDIFSLGEYESPLTKLFQKELYDELGWEVDEDEEVATAKELVEKLNTAVSESSKPQYASEELQSLDDFVKQGGKLQDYFNKTPGGTMDLTDPDLTSEVVQKDIVREYLSAVRGYKEERIKRTLSRHEEGGILEEEAEDALELLKEYKSDSQKRLLDAQEKYADNVEKQQQNFYFDVQDNIKNLKDIRGIKISGKDKQELLDYIFKPESDGRTKYQKEYASNVNHLIESAFFTKDKDKNTLVTKAKQSAKSDAYKEIHQKIKASKGKRQKSSGGQDESEGSGTLGMLGHSLIRKV